MIEECKIEFLELSVLYQKDFARIGKMILRLSGQAQADISGDRQLLLDSLKKRRELLANLAPKLQSNSLFAPIYAIVQKLAKRTEAEERLLNGNFVGTIAYPLYQDSYAICKNAHQYMDEIAYYEDLMDMSQFERASYNLSGINTLEIFKKNIHIRGGVVIIHGLFISMKFFQLMGLRLASKGYRVILIDAPGHGGSSGLFNIGVLVEGIYAAVARLREHGADKVAVIGHSAGGIGAMFACANYNHALESDLMELMRRVDAEMQLLENQPGQIAACLDEVQMDYEKMKGYIENAINANPLHLLGDARIRTRIDAIVCVSAPDSLLRVSPMSPKVLKRIGFIKLRFIVDQLINKPLSKDKTGFPFPRLLHTKKTKKLVEYELRMGTKGREGTVDMRGRGSYAELLELRDPRAEFKDFLEYMEKIQNPGDYMQLLLFFSERLSTGGFRSQIIHDFVNNYVRQVPKLFIYGNEDFLLKPQSKNNRERIESVYRMMGNARIKCFSQLGHCLIQGTSDLRAGRAQTVTAPQVIEEIDHFLSQRLR